MKWTVLFLCTGNSCRSQMAEGWTRHLWGDHLDVYSAGTKATKVDPLAVQVMSESGVDISGHRSKDTAEFVNMVFDYVITVCDTAKETCPYYPARVKVLHKGFDDPPKLAKKSGNIEEVLDHYRRVRDEIRSYIETLPAALNIINTERVNKNETTILSN